MNKRFFSIIAVFVVVAAALLVQATSTGTSEVILPSSLAQSGGSSKDLKRIRVAGRVAVSEVRYQVEPSIELRFDLQDPGKAGQGLQGPSIPVLYNGIKPDMFASGRDVIIDGDYLGGVLVASKLLTQCPSKYEPPSVDKMYPNK